MGLKPFKNKHYDRLLEWIDSEELNYLWGGPRFKFPLDTKQLIEHYQQSEVIPFIYCIDGNDAGYVELYRVSEFHFRICRVFVSSDYRGKGIAKCMLNALIELAQYQFDAHDLSLAVFERNTVARQCYESLGFSVVSVESDVRSFSGEAWPLIHMEKRINVK